MSKKEKAAEKFRGHSQLVLDWLLKNGNGWYVAAEGEPSLESRVVGDGGLVRRLENSGEIRGMRIVGGRGDPVLRSFCQCSRRNRDLDHAAAGAEHWNLGGVSAG